MGAALAFWLAARLNAAGLDPSAAATVNSLLDPIAAAGESVLISGPLRLALAEAIRGVFVIAFVAALLGLAVTFFAPKGRIERNAAPAGPPREEPAAAAVQDS
jgi:hypothetical protein